MQRTALMSPFGTNSVSICLSAARILSFVLTVLSGLWYESSSAAGDVEFAARLSHVHLSFGILFMILACYSVWAGRERLLRLFTAPDSWCVQACRRLTTLYIVLLLCVSVSAIAVMAGADSSVPFHAGAGLILVAIVVFQLLVHVIRKK